MADQLCHAARTSGLGFALGLVVGRMPLLRFWLHDQLVAQSWLSNVASTSARLACHVMLAQLLGCWGCGCSILARVVALTQASLEGSVSLLTYFLQATVFNSIAIYTAYENGCEKTRRKREKSVEQLGLIASQLNTINCEKFPKRRTNIHGALFYRVNLSFGSLSGDMTNPQNVELEAAKFLQKLIQESKDEPSKLATKLYVILQHMRSTGKENSMPYQVISSDMETVIKEHSLDIETLMSSCLAAGAQIGDSTSQQLAGSSQLVVASTESQSGNEIGAPETYASARAPTGPRSGGQDMYQGSAAHITGGAVKAHGVSPGAPASYLSAELANRMQFGNSSFDSHGFASKMTKDRSMEVFNAMPSGDHSSGKNIVGKTMDPAGSSATNVNMGSFSSSPSETNMLRTTASRDVGKSPVSQASSVGLPFKEQQLKQLRAQCFVFLAFRNGLIPKKLYLEIALGNIYSKEDGTRLMDQKGKEQLCHDPSSVSEVPRSLERPDSSPTVYSPKQYPERIQKNFLDSFEGASTRDKSNRKVKYLCTEVLRTIAHLIPLPHHLRANDLVEGVPADQPPSNSPVMVENTLSPVSEQEGFPTQEKDEDMAPKLDAKEQMRRQRAAEKQAAQAKKGTKRARDEVSSGGRTTQVRTDKQPVNTLLSPSTETGQTPPILQRPHLGTSPARVIPTHLTRTPEQVRAHVVDHSYLGWDLLRVANVKIDRHPHRSPDVNAYLCSNTLPNLERLPTHLRRATEDPTRSWTTNLETAARSQTIYDNLRLSVVQQSRSLVALERAMGQLDENCRVFERAQVHCDAAEKEANELRELLKAEKDKADQIVANQSKVIEENSKLKEELAGLRTRASTDRTKLEKTIAVNDLLQKQLTEAQWAFVKSQQAAQDLAAEKENLLDQTEVDFQVDYGYVTAYADCLRSAHQIFPEDPLLQMKEEFYTFLRSHPIPPEKYKLPIADLSEFGCDFSFLPAGSVIPPFTNEETPAAAEETAPEVEQAANEQVEGAQPTVQPPVVDDPTPAAS
ncbi:hypothetical protein ACS0TY_005399 [Phlomoides rotata]